MLLLILIVFFVMSRRRRDAERRKAPVPTHGGEGAGFVFYNPSYKGSGSQIQTDKGISLSNPNYEENAISSYEIAFSAFPPVSLAIHNAAVSDEPEYTFSRLSNTNRAAPSVGAPGVESQAFYSTLDHTQVSAAQPTYSHLNNGGGAPSPPSNYNTLQHTDAHDYADPEVAIKGLSAAAGAAEYSVPGQPSSFVVYSSSALGEMPVYAISRKTSKGSSLTDEVSI